MAKSLGALANSGQHTRRPCRKVNLELTRENVKTHFACDEEFSTGACPATQEY